MKLPSLLLIVAILIATAGILETNAATVVSSVTTIIGTSFLTTNLTYTVCIGDTVIATYPADPVLLLYNSTGLYTYSLPAGYYYYVIGAYVNTTTNHVVAVIESTKSAGSYVFSLLDTYTGNILANYTYTDTGKLQPMQIVYIGKNVMYFDGLMINSTGAYYIPVDVTYYPNYYTVVYTVPTDTGYVNATLHLSLINLGTSAYVSTYGPFNLYTDGLTIPLARNVTVPILSTQTVTPTAQGLYLIDYPLPFSLVLINDTYAIYSQALGPFIIIDNTTMLRGASIRGVTAIEYPIQNNYIVGQLLAYTGGHYPFIAWFITNTTISSTLPGTLYQAQYGSDAYMLYEQTASLLNSTVSATAVYSPASPTSITISALTATTITQPNITAEAVSWKSNGTLSYSVKAVTLEPVSIDWQNYLGLLITLSGYVNVTYTGTATANITTSKGITGNGITSVYLLSLLALGYRYVGYGCNTGDVLYNVSIPGTTYHALFSSIKEYTLIPLSDLSSPVYPGQWFTLDNLTIKPVVVWTSYTPSIGGNNAFKTSDYYNYMNKLLLPPVDVNITLYSTVAMNKYYDVALYYYGGDNGLLYTNNTSIGVPVLNTVIESRLVPSPDIPNYIQRIFVPSPDGRIVPFISTAVLEKCSDTVLPILEQVPVIGFIDTTTGKVIYQVKMDYPDAGHVEDIVDITGSIIVGVAEENGVYYGIVLMPYGYPSVYSGTLFTIVNLTSGEILCSKDILSAYIYTPPTFMLQNIVGITPIPYATPSAIGIGTIFYNPSTKRIYSFSAPLPPVSSIMAIASGTSTIWYGSFYNSTANYTLVIKFLNGIPVGGYNITGTWSLIGGNSTALWLTSLNSGFNPIGEKIMIDTTTGTIKAFPTTIAASTVAWKEGTVNPYTLSIESPNPIITAGLFLPKPLLDLLVNSTTNVYGSYVTITSLAYSVYTSVVTGMLVDSITTKPIMNNYALVNGILFNTSLAPSTPVISDSTMLYLYKPAETQTTTYVPSYTTPSTYPIQLLPLPFPAYPATSTQYTGQTQISTSYSETSITGYMTANLTTSTVTLTVGLNNNIIDYTPAIQFSLTSRVVLGTPPIDIGKTYSNSAVILNITSGTSSQGVILPYISYSTGPTPSIITLTTPDGEIALADFTPAIINTTYIFAVATLPTFKVLYNNTSTWTNLTMYTIAGEPMLLMFKNTTTVSQVLVSGVPHSFTTYNGMIVVDPGITVSIKYGLPPSIGGTTGGTSASLSTTTTAEHHVVMGGRAYSSNTMVLLLSIAVLLGLLLYIRRRKTV